MECRERKGNEEGGGGGEGEVRMGERENWNEVEGDKELTMQPFVWAIKSLK